MSNHEGEDITEYQIVPVEAELSKMKARHVSDLSRAMGLLDSLGYQDSYLNNRLAAISEHDEGEK